MRDVSWSEHYRMVGPVARGDAMEAYRAVDAHGAEVVVKVTRPRDPGRFLSQMAATAKAAHPNVVRVLDWGKDAELCWVVTEPVDGVDLRAVLGTEGRLPSESAALVGEQAAAGLAALHAQGVIHGGVAPHTLVRGLDGSVKIVDVGLRAAVLPLDLSRGAPAAAAWYSSPEEVMSQPLTPAADQYGLGEVLFELVTGRRPFEAADAFTVADMQVSTPPQPPTSVAVGVLPSLEAVILRAMEKRPEDRYPATEDMRRDLESIVRGVHVPSSGGPAAVSPRRRRPVWPWLVAGLVVVIAGALAAAWALGVFGGGGGIAVPDLEGKTEAQAKKALTAVGLRLGEVKYEEGVTADTPGVAVVSQSPKAGKEVAENSVVDVTMGADLVAVPDVVGKGEAEAVAALSAAKLKLDEVKRQPSDEVEAGLVIEQTPRAGTQVSEGATVTLVVSTGPATATVPDVRGKTQEAATQALTAAGYEVDVEEQSSDSVSAGSVISQDPSAGVQAAKGSTVTIVVSTGPAPSPPPTETETPET